MNQRFVAFLIMLAIGLQGPTLAYAASLTAKTMPSGCTSQMLGQSGHDNAPCCPDNMGPGLCCGAARYLAVRRPWSSRAF